MDKGKAPMTPGYEKRLKQQQDRRHPELVLGGMRNNRNNQQPEPAPKSKPPPVLQQKKTRPPLGRMRTAFDFNKVREEIIQEKRREAQHQQDVKKWNILFCKICRYVYKRIRRGKDWVMTEAEDDIQKRKFPEVC